MLIYFCLAALISGCEKSSPIKWANNPSKIILAKKGENLDDLSYRVLNKDLKEIIPDFKANSELDVFESNGIWIRLLKTGKGNVIWSIEQHCDNIFDRSEIGGSFDGLDCGFGSIQRLTELVKSNPSKFIEYCQDLEVDYDQTAEFVVNIKKNIFWYMPDGKMSFYGMNNGKLNSMDYYFHGPGFNKCDLKARAISDAWYTPGYGDNCRLDKKGPLYKIEQYRRYNGRLNIDYTVDEVFDSGRVVIVTIKEPNSPLLTPDIYIKGRNRCEKYNRELEKKIKAENKSLQEKYK